jgi:putative transposase
MDEDPTTTSCTAGHYHVVRCPKCRRKVIDGKVDDRLHHLVKQIKGRSSRLLRQQFPHLKSRMPTLWTNSYFVTTTGGATSEAVMRYVENQRNV